MPYVENQWLNPSPEQLFRMHSSPILIKGMDNPPISEHRMAIGEKVKISVQIANTVGKQSAPNNNKFRSLCYWLPFVIREIMKDFSPEGSMLTVQNACILCMCAYT